MGQLEPTRQEIIEAHQVVKDYIEHELDVAHNEADIKEALRRDELLLKFLPPLPRPTMNDIKWDDNEHFLAEAEHPNWGKVVMLYEFDEFISFMQTSDGPKVALSDVKERFTPTGRRYTLKEIDND